MVYSPRIGPDGRFAKDWADLNRRLGSLESKPAGNIFIRETLTTEDPETGVKTVLGQLPDGTYGIQPFVGDITPPPVATVPLTTVQPGLITIGWDGKFVGNAARPRDFEQVNVIGHKIEGGTTTLTLTVGVIRNANASCFISEEIIAEDETWQFSLESEDFNGNKAALSTRSAIVTMIGIMSPKLVEDKLQELRDEDTALHDRADQTQDDLSAAQALADALLAKGQNLAANGDFDMPLVTGKPVTGWPSLTLSAVTVNATAARTGTQFLRSAPLATPAYGYTNDVNAASGRSYRAEYWVKLEKTATVTDGTASVGALFTTTKLDGTSNAATVIDTSVPVLDLSTTIWTKVSVDYTVPFAVSKIKFGPRVTGNGNVYQIDSFKATDVTDALAAQNKADNAFAIAQQAASAAGTAGSAANSKNTNWFLGTAPAGNSHKNGDTWFDTANGNAIRVWDASANSGNGAWIDMQDRAISAAAQVATGAKATADGKNTSYYGTDLPTGGTYKKGDLFFDTDDGNKLYLYSVAPGSTGWRPFQDQAIIIANQAATGAQLTASGKNTSYYEPVAPTNVPAGTLKKGDLWFNTGAGEGNRLSTWSGTAWQTTQDMAATMVEVAKKGRTLTQATVPAVEFRNDTNLWIDISAGENQAVTKYWDAAYVNPDQSVGAWRPVADKGIKQVQDAVTLVPLTIMASAAPTGSAARPSTLWIDTTNGINLHKKWDAVNGWTVVADTRIAATVVSASAAGVSAQTAYAESQKNRTFTSDVQPAVEFRNSTTTWIDTSLGDDKAVTKRWGISSTSPGVTGWFPVKDGAIEAARIAALQEAANDATAKSDAAFTAAINAQAYSKNASFDEWTTSIPYKYGLYGDTTTIVKETSIVRKAPNALRFNVPLSTTSSGVHFNDAYILGHAPNLEFATVEIDFYLVSGTLAGAGVLLDWGSTNGTPRATIKLEDEVPDVVTGKWYRVSRVVKRPSTTMGTFTQLKGYLMGNYTVIGSAAKEIVYDWLNVRPSTAEEILAYTGPTISYVDARALAASAAAVSDASLKLAAKNKTYFQPTKPSSGINGDVWIDSDDGNKVYVYDSGDYTVAQDTAIDKALYSTFTTDIDSNSPDRWLYTKYNKNLASGATPQYSDIVGFAGTSALVDSGTDLVKNQGANYMGQLRTIVNVISAKTVSITATHDDGARIYVDGNSVYSHGVYQTNKAISFDLTAGWHVLDFLWNEISGNDGWYGITPTIRSQVDAMFAPVSLTAVASMASAAQLSANGKARVIYSNDDATGTAYTEGDTWFKRSLTSPFNIIGQWEFNSGAWRTRKIDGLTIANIDAGTITVGTLSGQSLSATALNGKVITGSTIQTDSSAVTGTAGRGIKLTSTELVGYDGSGNKNFRLTTGGTLQLKGELQSGSTISGATLSASGIYTNPATDRGVKIKDTGIRAWDVNGTPTFVLDATTGEVEVPGLKASSIKGSMIEANSIGVEKLTVMSLDNLVSEPTFKSGGAQWGVSTTSAPMSIDPTGSRNAGPAFKVIKDATTQFKYNTPMYIPVDQNQQYLLTAWVKSSVTIPANGFTFCARITDKDGNSVIYNDIENTTTIPANTWTAVSGVANTGSAAVSMSFKLSFNSNWTTGTAWVDQVSATRMAGGSLIVDGAIDGKVITGPTIQTNSGAVSGTAARGIKLTPNELAGYDGNGKKNFALNVDGSLSITGDIESGSTIKGATLSGTGIETSTLATKGVKITSAGIKAYNSSNGLTFHLDSATGLLEVPGIKTNSLTGDLIAADTISADHLLISDFTNLVDDEAIKGAGWTESPTTTATEIVTTTGAPGNAWCFAGNSVAKNVNNKNVFTVTEGDKFFMSARSQNSTNSSIYMRINWRDNANVSVGVTDLYFGANTPWTTLDKEAVAPADAVKGFVSFSMTSASTSSSAWIAKPIVRRKAAGKLIVDGAITTDHMTTNTIDAKVIATGTLTGDKIEAGTISAEKLTVGLGTNLIPDPGFLVPTISGSTGLRNTNSTMTVGLSSGGDQMLTMAGTGSYYYRATGVAQSAGAYKNWIPVTPGEKYVFSANINIPAGGTGDMRLTGRTKDGQATSTAFSTLNPFPALVEGMNTYYAEVPAGCYWMLPEIRFSGVAATAYIIQNTLSLRRRATGELIVDGAITTDHMTAGTIDGHIISSNTLKGDQIMAGTISASNMLLSSQDNLVENGGFEYGLSSWNTVTGFTIDPTGGRLSGSALKVTGITARTFGNQSQPYVAVENDDSFRISGWVKTTATSGHRAELCLYWYETDGTFVGNSNFYIDPTGNEDPTGVADPAVGIPLDNTWRYFAKLIKPNNSTASKMRVRLNSTMTAASSTMWFDDISVTRATGGTLIVDGAIQANHVRAGAIDASKIAAGAITASAIGSKSVTTDKLIVSSSNNLIIEPDFSLNGISWTTAGTTITVNATAGRGSTPALRFTGTTAVQNSYNLVSKNLADQTKNVTNKVVVDDDHRYRASVWVKSTAALPANAIKLAHRRYTTATAQTAFTIAANSVPLVANTWTQITGISPKLPANTIATDFYLIVDNVATGDITDIDSVSVTRATDGELVVDGTITATKLESNLVLTSKIIAGPSGGTHAEMSAAGFKVFAANTAATGGAPTEAVRLGVQDTDDFFAITQADGKYAASISQDGQGSFSQLSVLRPVTTTINASSSYTTGGFWYDGKELTDLLEDRPKGVVAAAMRTTYSANNAVVGGPFQPYLRLEAVLDPKRLYKVWTSPIRIDTDAGIGTTTQISFTSNNTLATTNSSVIMKANTPPSVAGGRNTVVLQELFAILNSAVPVSCSFLLMFGIQETTAGNQAGIRATPDQPVRLVIEDVGRNTAAIGNGTYMDGTAPPAPAKNNYVKQYTATSWQNYQGNNSAYTFDNGHLYQGQSPAGYGSLKSIAIFPSWAADLSGATVNYVRVYMNFAHWYYNSGGTAGIGVHPHTSAPGTFTAGTGGPVVLSGGWPKPGARWVDIPSDQWPRFINEWKGIYLFGDSTYNTYGYADRPTIEIGYNK